MYNQLFITSAVTAKRKVQDILAEYKVDSADIKQEGRQISFTICGMRDERLTPPVNGDLWVLATDSGKFFTNDQDGQLFKYAVTTEEDVLYLNEEQTIAYLKSHLPEETLPLGTDDYIADLQDELAKGNPDMDIVDELLSAIDEESPMSLDGLRVSKIGIATQGYNIY